MRDMPFPFELEGKVGVGFFHKICRDFAQEFNSGGGVGDWSKLEACFGVDFAVCEPTSVLETKRSPSPSASTSTLSSSRAGGNRGGVSGGSGGGSTDTVGLATVSSNPSEKWPQGHPQNHQETSNTHSTENSGNSSNNNNNVEASGGGLDLFQQIPTNLDVEKCGGLEYWDTQLLDSGSASPGQDQSILRLIMGDGEDPSMGLNRLLQGSGSAMPNHDFHFGAGGLAGVVDQGFGFDPVGVGVAYSTVGGNNLVSNNNGGEITLNELISPSNPIFTTSSNTAFPISLPLGQLNHQSNRQPPQNPHSQMFDCPDEKSHVLNNPHLLISQLQAQNTQNPAFFLLDQQLPVPPSKRHNTGIPKMGPSEPGQLPLSSSAQQLHLLPYMAGKPKLIGDEMMIQQKAIIDQLYKAAEMVGTGNPILAQEILARLNHQLSPTGKPFCRVAFYFKEALRLLTNSPLNSTGSTATPVSPFNVFFKIGAYKSFSEMSPLVQFTNFTCNQALLEALEGFDRIRVVDFDIGYGSQWASLMQELALRKGGGPALKITAFTSPAIHDQLELGLARENLNHFAREMNLSFEFEAINLDYLTMPLDMAEGEAIAVNLPISSLCNSPVPPTLVLRFIKQLYPKIVVTIDRGCDRTDLPFAHHILQAFQSYLVLVESLDSVNTNLDTLQKIETFLVRPGIEKLILGHSLSPEKPINWKTLFLSAGFTPVNFSNFTECQAEWLLKRTVAGGFHVEKSQSSLVLCWQRKELISASAWRC